jgi:hypothetical protein
MRIIKWLLLLWECTFLHAKGYRISKGWSHWGSEQQVKLRSPMQAHGSIRILIFQTFHPLIVSSVVLRTLGVYIPSDMEVSHLMHPHQQYKYLLAILIGRN